MDKKEDTGKGLGLEDFLLRHVLVNGKKIVLSEWNLRLCRLYDRVGERDIPLWVRNRGRWGPTMVINPALRAELLLEEDEEKKKDKGFGRAL